MDFTFNSSKDFTVGVEIEMQLVDSHSLGLVGTSADILADIKDDKQVAGFVKHELMTSNLEIITDVCANVDEVEGDLKMKLKRVMEAGRRCGTLLCGAGTHPFSLARDQEVTKDKRYNRLLNLLQIVARQFNIFGMHVHVGVDGAEKSIYVFNRMIYYLPHILALSANSPLWEGEETGLRSYRTKIFETLPIAGLPFYFKDWDDYATLVKNYINTGTIETIRELWWDVRPHPDFGTVEVRICDTPSTLKDIKAIASFVQALVKRFSDDFDKGVPFTRPHSSVIRENKWRACRFGLEGMFITRDGKATVRAKDLISEITTGLAPQAQGLGALEGIQGVFDILERGTGAARQIEILKNTGDYKEVERSMVEKLNAEVCRVRKNGA